MLNATELKLNPTPQKINQGYHIHIKGDLILIVKSNEAHRRQKKIDDPVKEGPHPITKVLNNGTNEILRGNLTENISIRVVEPYHANQEDE